VSVHPHHTLFVQGDEVTFFTKPSYHSHLAIAHFHVSFLLNKTWNSRLNQEEAKLVEKRDVGSIYQQKKNTKMCVFVPFFSG